MRNILTIFRDDLRTIRGNVMTAVIVFGLAIIPLLFTTFNVLASWDPFSNAKQLQIAVASDDEGHQSDLASIKLNLGDEVLSQLSRNDEIDWVLTSSEDAIEGTKSGEYYAGIVLPKTFSSDLLTFYVEGAEPSKLSLYTNEKKNALSTTITQKSATGVIQKIDESFTRVVANVGLGVISSLDDYLDEGDTQAALNNVHNRVKNVQTRLDAASGTVMALSNLVDSTIPLTQAADNILSEASRQAASTDNDQGRSPIDILQSTLNESTGSLDASLAATTSSYDALSSQIEELLGNANATTAQTAQTFRSAADRVAQQTAAFEGVRAAIKEEADKANLPGPVNAGYHAVMGHLDAAIAQSNSLHDTLSSTASNLENGGGNSNNAREDAKAAIASAKQAVEKARNSYNQNLKPQLDALGQSVATVAGDIDTVKKDIAGIRSSVAQDSNSPQQKLQRARDITSGLATKLQQQARRFDEMSKKIDDVRKGGDLSQLAGLIGDDPELLASRIAAPVHVDRQPVYEVASFGSGMTPFYLTLSLWVGALLACVLIHTNAERKYLRKGAVGEAHEGDDDVEDGAEADSYEDSDSASSEGASANDDNYDPDLDDDAEADNTMANDAEADDAEAGETSGAASGWDDSAESEDENTSSDDGTGSDGSDDNDDDSEYAPVGPSGEPFTRNQVFLGRFATFALIGIAQATLAVLSLILFVEIKPEHPIIMVLASWVIMTVFMLIIYSLVITFDSAGKAIAVLLLVVQVSGSGGAYPLPLLPGWFQSVSPWLPATYGIDAFRSAIAGIYQADILRELGILLLFAIPSLILGLFLRRAMDNYHTRLQKAIKKTKVMA